MLNVHFLTEKHETYKTIRHTGTRYVIDACLRHNVQHMIYTSSIEAICPNMTRDHFVDGDEDTLYSGPAYSSYGRSKFEGEKLVVGSHGYKMANQEVWEILMFCFYILLKK